MAYDTIISCLVVVWNVNVMWHCLSDGIRVLVFHSLRRVQSRQHRAIYVKQKEQHGGPPPGSPPLFIQQSQPDLTKDPDMEGDSCKAERDECPDKHDHCEDDPTDAATFVPVSTMLAATMSIVPHGTLPSYEKAAATRGGG
jgi:hypothetical protein